MNNIIRRLFNAFAVLSFGYMALLFCKLSQISTQLGAGDFATLFDVGVAGALVMIVVSLLAVVKIYSTESAFITKASTIFFTIASGVYLIALYQSDTLSSLDWALVATISMAIFGWYTVNNPVIKPTT